MIYISEMQCTWSFGGVWGGRLTWRRSLQIEVVRGHFLEDGGISPHSQIIYLDWQKVGGGVLNKRSSGDTRERTSLPFTGENSASCFLYKFAFRQKLTFKCLSQKQYHSFTNHSGIEKFTRVLSLLTTFSILLFFSSIHLYFYRVVTKKNVRT